MSEAGVRRAYERICTEIKDGIKTDLIKKERDELTSLRVYIHPVNRFFALVLGDRTEKYGKLKEIYERCFGEGYSLHGYNTGRIDIPQYDGLVFSVAIVQVPEEYKNFISRWKEVTEKISTLGDEITEDTFSVLPLCKYKVNAEEGNSERLAEFVVPNLSSETETENCEYLPRYVRLYMEYISDDKLGGVIYNGANTLTLTAKDKEHEEIFYKNFLRFLKDTEELWDFKSHPRPKSLADLARRIAEAGQQEELQEQEEDFSPLDLADVVLASEETKNTYDDEDYDTFGDYVLNVDEVFFYRWMI